MKLPNTEEILVKGAVISGVFDIPAKSDAMGLVNHRAQHACSRCLHPGEIIQTVRGIARYMVHACMHSHNYVMLYNYRWKFESVSTYNSI